MNEKNENQQQTVMVNKKVVEEKVSSLTDREPNSLGIYGCGGAGANIARTYFKFVNQNTNIFSNILPVVLDASDSDLTTDIPDEYVYIVKDETGEQLEGGGKIRATNYDHVKKSIKDMLIKYQPCDFNIVIHSNSGAKQVA